jgi:DNA-binding NarL/FixJ family response regulator
MTPRVLLVDDEPAILGALRRIVQKARPDAIVVYASDVATATWQLRTTAIRFVITDMKMGGDDAAGWAVVDAARKLDVAAVIITGNDETATVDRARRLGVRLLHKPVNAPALAKMVEEVFATTSTGDFPAIPYENAANG